MRRNKLNKAVHLLLAMALLFTMVLSGCSGDNASENEPDDTSTQQPSQDNTSQTATGPDYVNPAGVFPIATKDITLKFVVPQTPNVQDYNTNAFTKWLEEKSGCKLEFTTFPYDDFANKVQLSLASNTDLPDVYTGPGKTGSNIFSTTNVIRYGQEGQIIPLSGLIDEYAPELKDAFTEYSEQGINLEKMMTSADGNIYYMPVFVVAKVSRTSNKLWMNKDWMDKLGLNIPTTTEELYDVLKAFKERDPNENGKADEIPMVGTDSNYFYAATNYLMGSFTENNAKFSRMYADDSGKLVYAPITNEWREGLKYINRLTSEGLLSPLSFTQNQDNLKQIANDPNDICGSFSALGLNHIVTEDSIVNKYTHVVPVKGPEGVQLAVDNPPIPSGQAVITSACKYPEVAIRVLDLMLSDDGDKAGRYGVEGVDWVEPAAGDMDKYGNPATIKVLIDHWGKPQNAIWWGTQPRINDKYNDGAAASSLSLAEQKNNPASVDYLKYLPKSTIGMLIYPADKVDRINELQTQLDANVVQKIAEFAVGGLDPNNDADWEKYLKECKNMGLDEFMELSQEAYNRQ